MVKVAIQNQNSSIQFQNKWLYLDDFRAWLLLVLACAVCYGNTVFNDYAFDDDFSITDNALVQKGIAGIPEILTNPYYSSEGTSMDYRPVSGISFAVEHEFFGANPHVSHFVNMVLFILCVLMVFIVLKRVFGLHKLHPILPLLIALIYAVHPVHTEVVSSLKNRDEIFSLLFALLAFLFAFHLFTFPDKQLFYTVIVLAFMLLSFVSKVTSIPFVAMIIVTGLFYGFQKQKQMFYIFHLLLITLMLTYLAILLFNLERPNFDLENPLLNNHDISIQLGTAFESLYFYFKFMFVPFPFRFYYGYNAIPLINMSDFIAMMSFLIHLFLFSYGVWLFFRKQVLGLIFLCYLLSIVPYSNFFGMYPGIVAERVLFSPSVWFISASILFVFRAAKFEKAKGFLNPLQKSVIILGLIFFIAYTWLTIQRNFQWKDNLTLMEADIPHLQNSTLANFIYANNLSKHAHKIHNTPQQRQVILKALKHYKQAVSVSPDFSQANLAIAKIYYDDLKDPASALEYAEKPFDISQANLEASYYAARSALDLGQLKKADYYFTSALKADSSDIHSLYYAARNKFMLGDTVSFLLYNNRLARIAPTEEWAYLNFGTYYYKAGDRKRAFNNFELALKYNFDPELCEKLFAYFRYSGDTLKADYYLSLLRKNR